jgi:hypothetical protein
MSGAGMGSMQIAHCLFENIDLGASALTRSYGLTLDMVSKLYLQNTGFLGWRSAVVVNNSTVDAAFSDNGAWNNALSAGTIFQCAGATVVANEIPAAAAYNQIVSAATGSANVVVNGKQIYPVPDMPWIDIPVTWNAANGVTAHNCFVKYNPSAKLLFVKLEYLPFAIPNPAPYEFPLGTITLPVPIESSIPGSVDVELRKSGTLLDHAASLLKLTELGEILLNRPYGFDLTLSYSNLEIRGSVMFALM